jgi:hypothetical protein
MILLLADHRVMSLLFSFRLEISPCVTIDFPLPSQGFTYAIVWDVGFSLGDATWLQLRGPAVAWWSDLEKPREICTI